MNLKKNFLVAGLAFLSLSASAEYPINYKVDLIGATSNSSLAPYYMASNRHGILTQGKDALLLAGAWKPMTTDKRFSYGFGVQLAGGAQNATGYNRFYSNDNYQTAGDGHWGVNYVRPNSFWIQQLYGEIKYRSVFLSIGQKDRGSALLNNKLSSGDVMESGNARSIPQARAGFIDFQNIPFTKGALQIQGEVAYGVFTQNNWLKSHFSFYSGHYCLNTLYHYKRMYFRTKPEKPFSVIFGGQVAAIFGGTNYHYGGGKFNGSVENRHGFQAFWQAFIPRDNGIEGYVEGSHLGSWDIVARYRFKNGAEVKAYLQNLWEDGSGMGKLNGWDGLWGLEYKAAQKGILTGAVIEYVDFRNQGGPTHWDPIDNPGTSLGQTQATGGDNYYNNGFYNSYSNYGMSIGTPFLKAPIYYKDGQLSYMDTRMQGVHIGLLGNPVDNFEYRILWSWRRSLGTYGSPRFEPQKCNSFMAEGTYNFKKVEGLTVSAQIAFDRGMLYGNNFGGSISVSYSGLFNL